MNLRVREVGAVYHGYIVVHLLKSLGVFTSSSRHMYSETAWVAAMMQYTAGFQGILRP
jgi:hypothetical protein